jgi:hypothetical protein
MTHPLSHAVVASTMIHIHEGEISAAANVREHEHSNGPYAVVDLQLGGLQLTIFPEGNAAKLSEVLSKLSADLAVVVEQIAAAKAVHALSD